MVIKLNPEAIRNKQINNGWKMKNGRGRVGLALGSVNWERERENTQTIEPEAGAI